MSWRIAKRLKKINLKIIFTLLITAALIYFAQPQLPYFISGLALVILGEIVRVWATGHLQKNEVLTTSGPYAYVKNPMYVGSFLIMLGITAMAISPYAPYILALELACFIGYYVPYKKRMEGNRLLEKFGEPYADYDRHVPDYIPRRLKPYRPGSVETPQDWSKTIFLENNEHHVAFMVLVGVVLVTLRFWF